MIAYVQDYRTIQVQNLNKLEIWANAQRDMAALPNMGGALCSTPQSFLRIEFLSVVYSCVLMFSKFCRITATRSLYRSVEVSCTVAARAVVSRDCYPNRLVDDFIQTSVRSKAESKDRARRLPSDWFRTMGSCLCIAHDLLSRRSSRLVGLSV